MRLVYKAVTKDGDYVKGLIDANDVSEAAAYLRGRELYPVQITKQDNRGISKYIPIFGKIKSKDIVLFTRQISSMITAGITLIKALEILKEQAQSTAMIDLINEVSNDVQEGTSFSKAISKYPNAFSSIYVSLVKAGEGSGLLDKILLRLADNMERQQKLKGTIRSALMYPTIVIVMMVVVMLIMMIFVMPQLTKLYESLNVPLPFTTQIVIGMSNFIRTFWFIIAGIVGILTFAFYRWRKTDDGRLLSDTYFLKVPVFGKLIKERILAEFARTFGLLVGTGTLVVDALLQTSEVAGNKLYENSIKEIAKKVEKGVSVGDAIGVYPIFPQLLVQLIKVGEETGKIDETMVKASEYFETEVNQSVKNLTTAMEPFIMIILGIGVAFLIMSVITPIYGLVSNIQ
ncbi:MAG: type II secretion system F family protein [Candidatus Levybacteria bacterium]|nr:type II secretion system F family protein [Candidatus Levybacteria bacterium]MBI2421014.1 type II secretion system F family protein [Candidatus Levybacteria bacterium]